MRNVSGLARRFVRRRARLGWLLLLSLFVLGSALQFLPGPDVPPVAAQPAATDTPVAAATDTPPPATSTTAPATATVPPATNTPTPLSPAATATASSGATSTPGGSPTATPGTATPGTATPIVVATSTATAAALAGSTPTPVPTCFGRPATIIGTEGNDTLDAGNGNVDDVIVGLGGDDLIIGGNGDDRLCGGEGNDTLRGDNHDDFLDGGPGTDRLDGGNHNNTCIVGPGDTATNCNTITSPTPTPAAEPIIVPTATATATPGGKKLTLVARECSEYTDITANRARNNIQESLKDLGPDTLYGNGEAINVDTESRGQPNCKPLVGWQFTLGDGIAGGLVDRLSVVSNPKRSEVTQGSVDQLDSNGIDTGKDLAAAVTFDLNQDEIDLAAKAGLWVQGGRVNDPLGNGAFPGKYGFGALRCAIDNLNGDNVEFVSYSKDASHVFCYYYAVSPRLTPGTIIVKKQITPGDPATQTFRFIGNISYDPNPDSSRGTGYFSLKVEQGKEASISFDRAEVLPNDVPWTFQEESTPGWTQQSVKCESRTGLSKFEPPIGPPAEGGKVSVRLAGNDTVTCTYVNERARTGPLSLYKVTTGEVGVPFQFKVNVPNGEVLEYTTTTDTEDKPAVVVSVPSGPQGRYTVTETLPPPSAAGRWTVDRVECTPTQVEQSSDRTVVVVDVPPGTAPGTCIYHNRFTPGGKIVLRKQTLGGFGTTRFEVEPSRDPQAPGTALPVAQFTRAELVAETTQAGQTVTAIPVEGSLENIPLGDYVVTEILPPNIGGTWSFQSVTCDPPVPLRAEGFSEIITLTAERPQVTCTMVNAFTPAPPPVSPVLECIIPGTGGRFSAVFGYSNTSSTVTTIPIGNNNRFSPTPENRSQPTAFQPGRQRAVFTVESDGGNLVWTLDGHTATAGAGGAQCPTPTPTSTATPAGISPVLECVIDRGAGVTGNRYTAVFGYNNPNPGIVSVEVGPGNRFTPAPENRGQPATFDPGRKAAAFRVDFDGSNLVWSLLGRTSTVSSESQRCAPPTATATATATVDYSKVGGTLDCVEANADGSFRAYWSTTNDTGSTVRIAPGSRNPDNFVTGSTYTVPDGFPAFPPEEFVPGRTPYYPNTKFQILVPPGGQVVWHKPSRGSNTATVDGLPCSLHIFFEKQWVDANGQTTVNPPADLPETYRIVAAGQVDADGSPNAPRLPTSAVCTYPRQNGVPVAPLQCVYDNPIPPVLDNIGMWLQNANGRTYTVTEEGLPPPWVSSNVGSWTLPSKGCVPGVVPGFPGINKYCLHTITNRLPTPTPTITPGGPTLTPTPPAPPGTPTTATPTTPAETPAPTETVGPGTPSPTPGPSNTPGPGTPAPTPTPVPGATLTPTSTGGGGGGGTMPTPTLTPTPTASATDAPVSPVPPGPTEIPQIPQTPVPPGLPVVLGTPTPPPTGVLPGPPVPTVPIQTAVVIQTAVAQGTPFPPAVQTQAAITPGPVQPGLPGTGSGAAVAAGGAGGTAGAGGGSGAAGVALLAMLGALGVLFRRARRP